MRLVELRSALALCVVLASAVPAAGTVSFTTVELEDVVSSPSPGNPQAITLADVDGDNIDDLIAVEDDDSTTVFLNDGAGVLEADGSYFTDGEGPVAVSTGQFNADTFVDIVTVNNITGTVSIFFNDGEGFFDEEDPRQVGVGPNPIGVAVGDFNDDTNDDLAVLSADRIFLLQGNGDGTFSAFNPATITNQIVDGFTIATGTLDPGNDNLDLVVTKRNGGQLATYLGNGNGTFSFNGNVSAGARPTSFVIADANGDTNNDLIVADSQGTLTTELGLILNDGAAEFPLFEAFTGPEEPFAITALDVEPDSKVDLAVTNSLDDQIFLLCQPSDECVEFGQGGLEAGIWRPGVGGTVPGCTEGGQVAIASGRLNGDDKDDLVALKGDLITICTSLNTSRPGGSPIPTTPDGPSPTPSGPTSTPTATRTPSATRTPTGIPTIGAGICNTKDEPGFGSLGRPVAVTTEDFDRNGTPDVAVADSSGNRIVIVLTGFGTPNPNDPCMGLNLQTGAELSVMVPEDVVAADFDSDRKADLAVIGAQGLSIFYGDGSGAFSPSAANPISAGIDPAEIVVADFDSNSRPDLIIPDLGSVNVSIFLGTRQRNQPFVGPCVMPVGGQTNAAVSTDLNRDGRNDFAVVSPETLRLAIFLQVANAALDCNNMAGSFQGQTTHGLPGEPIGLVAGTFVLTDTVPDLVVAMRQQDADGTVLLFDGRSAGAGVTYTRGTNTTIPAPTVPPTPTPAPTVAITFSVPSAIGTGDIEDDGDIDLLLTDTGNNTFVEFRGQTSGGLGVPLIPEDLQGIGPADLAVADIDGDGRDDVIVANAGDGSLSYILTAQRANTPVPTPTTPMPPTATPPPVGTPTLTPTGTPTPTRSRAPSRTPTPVATNTQRGVVTLSGGGCAVNDASSGSGQMILVAFALAGLLARRIAMGRLRA